MQSKQKLLHRYGYAAIPAFLMASGAVWAQQAQPAPTKPAEASEADDEVIVLSPFEVNSEDTKGYTTATTLAGNRLNTELRDIGNAVTVVNSQMLKDIGATSNESLLQYTTNTEVGNVYGNMAGGGDGAFIDEASKFINPNQNTRVRGLTSADNSRDYFLSNVPWEGYNIDGVDLQRGPNSILFGQGSPGGIVNVRTKQASFKDSNEVSFRTGSFGSYRGTFDTNKVLLKGQLAVRVAGTHNKENFKQDPAFERQNRIYGALRYEPSFLKKNGNRTIIKGNVEFGRIDSNRPRSIPPLDMITPWFLTGTYAGRDVNGNPTTFSNLNRGTFIPSALQDDNTGLPNHGQMRPKWNFGTGQPNPYYQPWLGNFAQQFGGPLFFYNSNSSTPLGPAWTAEPKTPFGISSTGAIDGTLSTPYQRPASIASYSNFARNAKLPYSEYGVYKDKSLTDPTVFDFYNKLLDGPNKNEWQNFRTYNVSIAQTFLDDKFGFEAVHNAEHWKGGQTSLLSGYRQGIFMDVNTVYADGTVTGKDGEPFADGTTNPNVGRAFISDNGTGDNRETINDYSTSRLTAFYNQDFTRMDGGPSWLGRVLGKHTFTGLLAKDDQKSTNFSWQRYGITDPTYISLMTRTPAQMQLNANERLPNAVIYLGDSLAGRTTASGANLPNATAVVTIPSSAKVWMFDSHWNAPTVNPADVWENAYYPVGSTSRASTQSENPANYVGWRQVDVPITNADTSQAARDSLTTYGLKNRQILTSKAFVWQGSTWDKAIVATWGVRNDISKAYAMQARSNDAIDVNAIRNGVPAQTNRIEVTSHAWTSVAHLDQFPFIGEYAKKLPISISLFYNKSTNFQPASLRVDFYGEPLAPPSGKTIDRGILLETRDGKYSLKINKYRTTTKNATSSALSGAWFLGASQAWSGNWVNRFEYNWTGDTIGQAVLNPDPTNSQYNYATGTKADGTAETLADAQAREASVIAAWRAWQAKVDPRFYTAWNINLNDKTKALSASAPAGFSVTEDAASEGWEYELGAQPTRNWRISVNASKTEAVRYNIGGTALSSFAAAYEAELNKGYGSVGDLRIWWGGAGNDTALMQWNKEIGSEYTQRKLQEGTKVPELREWRFNTITNYDFDRGIIKGLNVGGGIRYESDIVIGYKPVLLPSGNKITFDLTDPYKGPSELNYDAWIGYSRKFGKIDWNIQLNVRNITAGNELIPITVQPDGSGGTYRIRPPRTWQLTNTFKF